MDGLMSTHMRMSANVYIGHGDGNVGPMAGVDAAGVGDGLLHEDVELAAIILNVDDHDGGELEPLGKDRAFSFESMTTSVATMSPVASPSPGHISDSNASTTSTSTMADLEKAEKERRAAIRRERNRDSMRRARHRDKVVLEDLRANVGRLEALYAQLTINWQRSQDATSTRAPNDLAEMRTKLERLVAARRELEAENAAAQERLSEQEQKLVALQQTVDDYQLESRLEEMLALLEPRPRDCPTLYGYKLMTLSDAQVKLEEYCHKVEAMKALDWPADVHTLEIFGWVTRQHISETNAHVFDFARQYDHLTAEDLLQRSWDDAMDLEGFKAANPQVSFRRLECIQHVSDNVVALIREIDAGPTILRTLYLAFRARTHEGNYVTGMQSINPSAEEQAALAKLETTPVHWLDASVSIEIVPLGPDSCEVRWRGETCYRTPQLAAVNAVKFLTSVLRWETKLLGPRRHLVFSV